MNEFEKKFQIFLEVAGRLNTDLDVVPILYGSLGLNNLIGKITPVSDIDVVIPDHFLDVDWPKLDQTMRSLGYAVSAEKKKEFLRTDERISFATESGLFDIPDFQMKDLQESDRDGVKFRQLTPKHYLDLYEYLQTCDYRLKDQRKSAADKVRIKTLRKFLGPK